MLIDQNRIAVGIHGHDVGGTGRALIGLIQQLYALGLQPALEFAHVVGGGAFGTHDAKGRVPHPTATTPGVLAILPSEPR